MNCSKCDTANTEGHRFCFNCVKPAVLALLAACGEAKKAGAASPS